MTVFDVTHNDNESIVKLSSTDNAWTLSKDDLNSHSAAWLINMLLGRRDSESI